MHVPRYAVVTGATKGIGRAIAERFLQEGYHVIGNYAHDDAAAAAMVGMDDLHQGRLTLIKRPLSSYEDAAALAEQIGGICGGELDVLVCNSGNTDRTAFPEIAPESWARVMDTNLNAPLFLTQGLADGLKRRQGNVIYISSVLGGG